MSQTLRHPTVKSPNSHDLKELSDALNMGREARASLVLDIVFSKPYSNLKIMATDKVLASGQMDNVKISQRTDKLFEALGERPSGSLEGIHGNYHVLIGGTGFGHMNTTMVASFDPVFWFHHW